MSTRTLRRVVMVMVMVRVGTDAAGAPGAVLGDELLAGSRRDKAEWWHGHGPSISGVRTLIISKGRAKLIGSASIRRVYLNLPNRPTALWAIFQT